MSNQQDRLATALAEKYVIERELGAGGMATVYLAEDVKHRRKVAVKVLRPELAALLGIDRFVQEIETTANLQHAHILPLFDSGEADGFLYYVMPFIDGESLREKLDRETQLEVDEAVRIASGVADALDYAHRQDVIHRDIKPENILLHDGRPVVADFGIALAVSAAAGNRMTETGLSLGTPHYMSPEQATADKELTGRSDIYSLASVLYEMLTGDPPHTGPSAQAIVTKVVTDDARPISELRKSVSPHVASAVTKALEKLPADRFATAAKFKAALHDPGFSYPVGATRLESPAATAWNWNRLTTVVSVLAAGLVLLLLFNGDETTVRPVTRVSIRTPVDQAFQGKFDISADGDLIVYAGPGEGGRGQLWARRRDALRATPIAVSSGAAALTDSPMGLGTVSFSLAPGGEELAFRDEASIRVISVNGSDGRTIAEGLVTCCVTWGADVEWIYFTNTARGLSRVPTSGGNVEVLTELDTASADLLHAWPEVLPGGRFVLFQSAEVFDTRNRIAILDTRTGGISYLMAGRAPRYVDGYLLFVDEDRTTLMGAPFDPARGTLMGASQLIAEDLTGDDNLTGGWSYFVASDNGTLLYSTGAGLDMTKTPVWVTRDGTATPVDPEWKGLLSFPKLSPLGDRIAISAHQSHYSWFSRILVKEIGGATFDLTRDGPIKYRPSWSPDGELVIFASTDLGTDRRPSAIAMYSVPADGSGGPSPVGLNAPDAHLSRDGEWFVYRTLNIAGDGGNIMAVRADGSEEPITLVATEFAESAPALSPDGRWIAYTSLRTGNWEVYVRPFPNAGEQRIAISTGGGMSPVWANSGRELFYKASRSGPTNESAPLDLIVATIRTTPTFRVESRRILFGTEQYDASFARPNYDISPDDQRFLMLQRSDAAPAP